jgi:hypothetical protein
MKQQEYLFELVQSLSKSEKRYFKLHSNLVSGSKSYLNLFEKLESSKEYDERKLLKRTRIDKKKLSVAKNYLHEQVLKSLRNFHSSISIRSRIHALLLNVEILYRKGLIMPGYKELKKARSLALKHEKFGLLQEILNWERQFGALGEKGMKNEAEIAEGEARILEMQTNVLKYQGFYGQLQEIKKEFGYLRGKQERDRVNEMMSDPLLTDIDKAWSVRARYYYHISYCQYYYLTGEFEKGYESGLKLLHLHPSSPLDESELLNGVLNHISSCFFTNRFSESLESIAIAEDLRDKLTIGKYEQIQTQVFYFSTYYRFPIYVKTGQIDLIVEMIEDAEKAYAKYTDLMSAERNSIFQEMLSLSYMIIGNFKRSLYWSNRLLYAGTKNIRHDVYVAVRVMNLIALVELEDQHMLTYSSNSAYRSIKMLNKADQSFEIELEIVRHMKRAPGKVNKSATIKWAEKLHASMTALLKDDDHEENEYSYFFQWLQSLIQQKPLTTIVKKTGLLMTPEGNS